MAYNIINSFELNNENNKYISVLKYAILKKNENYFLQLKLRNKSDFIIKSFDIVYKIDDRIEIYNVKNIDVNSNDTFFEKTLIPIYSENFVFVELTNIKGNKDKKNNVSKKNFVLLYGWALMLIILGFISALISVIALKFGSDSYVREDILSIIFFCSVFEFIIGITILIMAIILSLKAKREGIYDYHSNIKYLANCLLVLLYIIALIVIMILIEENFSSSMGTPSSSSF